MNYDTFRVKLLILPFIYFFTSTSVLAAQHLAIINGSCPANVTVRAHQVKQNVPPFPGSRRFDTAQAFWTDTAQVLGLYEKISDVSSIQWQEVSLSTPGYGGGGGGSAICMIYNTCHSTPLLLDLGRDGLQLSERGQGVNFDISSTGNADKFQWVKMNTNDGFLVRDINGNGIIDNGYELFGDGTIFEISQQKATNGYVALGQFDKQELGGNLDGAISEKDSIWSELLIWVDSNADGISQIGELKELKQFDIVSFDLNIKATKGKNVKTDRAGNIMPFWSWVTTKSTSFPNKLKMVDVFFKKIN